MSINSRKRVPWFMAIVNSSLLENSNLTSAAGVTALVNNIPHILTSKIIPESVSSNKPINYGDKPVPGGRTSIPQFANLGATQVSFSLKHANFNDQLGVVGIQKFFEMLRNPETGLAERFEGTSPFTPNPQVLYYYGTGSVPLLYFVTKCDFDLSNFNSKGFPQVIDVTIDLVLDENGKLYTLEKAFRSVINLVTQASIASSGFPSQKGTRNPHYTKGGVIPGKSRFFGRT